MMTDRPRWEESMGLAETSTQVALTCSKADQKTWTEEAVEYGYSSRSQYLYLLIQEARAYRKHGVFADRSSESRIEELEAQVESMKLKLMERQEGPRIRRDIDGREFLEVFLLPVPPDLVLIPLAVATPEFAFLYAAIATAGSVTAGLIGFIIGRKGGRPAVESRFAGERLEHAKTYFDEYGLATLGIGAFTPIPEGYELLSIASGTLGLDLRSYLLASLAGRGGKYFLEAALVLALGEAARSLSEPELYSIIGVATLVVLAAYLFRRRWMPDRWRTSGRGRSPPL